ncbi:MAG: ROK family protein [Phycisphaeraceae bacterium]
MTARLLGLNIGGTTCSAALGDADGAIHARSAWPAHAAAGPEAMIAQLLEHAAALQQSNAAAEAVGVAIGGPLNGRTGTILSPPNLPGWDRIPLAQRLHEALGLPVRVEHDAAACALAEYLWGAGQGADRLAYLTCGTGFGVGLILDGQPYYGADGLPPEIGHIAYRDDGPTAYGKRGCFEAFASASSLQRLAAWRFPQRWADNPPSPAQISQLAQQRDADALAVIALNAQAVGDSCALLIDLLGPRRILLGSTARYLGEPWVEQVRQQASRQVGSWTRSSYQIIAAGLGDRLQDCSALAAARLARAGG